MINREKTSKILKIKTMAICAIMALLCVFLTACTETVSYTFNCETGDSVKVSMNLTDSKNSFTVNGNNFVLKDEEGSEILYGGIDYKDNVDKYDYVSGYENINSGKFDHKDLTNINFIEFSNGTSPNCIQYCGLLPNSNSCIIVRCFKDKAESDKLMNNLSFKLDNK